jgi:hypothetical protein
MLHYVNGMYMPALITMDGIAYAQCESMDAAYWVIDSLRREGFVIHTKEDATHTKLIARITEAPTE